jgi:hypothetical protein
MGYVKDPPSCGQIRQMSNMRQVAPEKWTVLETIYRHGITISKLCMKANLLKLEKF